MPSCRCNGMNPDCCFCGGTGTIAGIPVKTSLVPEGGSVGPRYLSGESLSSKRRGAGRRTLEHTKVSKVSTRIPGLPRSKDTPKKSIPPLSDNRGLFGQSATKSRKPKKLKRAKNAFPKRVSGEGTFPSF